MKMKIVKRKHFFQRTWRHKFKLWRKMSIGRIFNGKFFSGDTFSSSVWTKTSMAWLPMLNERFATCKATCGGGEFSPLITSIRTSIGWTSFEFNSSNRRRKSIATITKTNESFCFYRFFHFEIISVWSYRNVTREIHRFEHDERYKRCTTAHFLSFLHR